MEELGIEPRAFRIQDRMRSERSTPELHPLFLLKVDLHHGPMDLHWHLGGWGCELNSCQRRWKTHHVFLLYQGLHPDHLLYTTIGTGELGIPSALPSINQ